MAKDLTQALAAASEAAQTSREDKRLPESRELPPIPARSGTGSPLATGSGGGIASPLTETAYSARLFHPEVTLISTDGFLSFKIKPVKEITFTDANAAVVKIIFKEPA